ncbi:NACHT, LRR and PYD domains-containing protein 3-like [Lissotriton helveticus]
MTSLTELSLRHNALGDAGLRRLCEGLKHPSIRLQKLDLCHCSLTSGCCADLALALCGNPSLLELNLSRNELGDSGLMQLCHGLKHPECRIEKLWLASCTLSGSCGAALASVLSTSQTLTTLCLGENELGDSAVMQLCEGLTEPGCKIQTFDLWLCSLTAPCCPGLASALMASPALTELTLSDNNLGDFGLRLLCDGLRNPGCRVQRLYLDSIGLTDDCIPDLCSALATNEALQTLTLNCNHLTDASITSFSQLRNTHGALPYIGTAGNGFTSSGREQLQLLMADSG